MKINKIFSIVIIFFSIALSVSFLLFPKIFTSHGNWGILSIFLANFVSGLSFFPAPSFVTVIAGSSIYPPFLIAIVSSLGAALGDMLFFLIGVSSRKIAKKKLEKKRNFLLVEKYFKKFGGWFIFVGSVVPNPIFDSFGLVAGIFNFSITRFFFIILIGRFLRYFLLAQVGRFY